MKPRSTAPLLMLLTIAALVITGAGTARAAGLRWSGPKLVDRTRPYGEPATISGLSCPTASFCLGVGSQGTVVRATASGPPRVVRNGVQSFAQLRDVSCPTTSLCFALSGTSSVLTSRNPDAAKPIFRKVTLKVGVGVLESIDCPTASLCVALASTGAVWTSTRPTGPAAGWRPTTLARTPRFLNAVGCAPGGRLCVASLSGLGGLSPQLATTTNPTAGATAWTLAPAPSSSSVSAISCPSTSFCAGISPSSGEVMSSANPAAGGSSWTATATVDPMQAGLGGIACGAASPASCVAAVSDGSVVVGSGAAAAPAWTRSSVLAPAGLAGSGACLRGATANCLMPVQRGGGLARILVPEAPSATVTGAGGLTGIGGLACPSASLCVGVDDAGAVLRTTNPAGPGSGWRRTVQPAASASSPEAQTGPTGLGDISCPTTRFCAAVGPQDTLLTTTTPGSSALWRVTRLPFILEESAGTFREDLGTISCASNALCVSTGSSNRLFVSTRPGGGPSAWRAFSLGAFNYDVWTSVACPHRGLCVAGDNRSGRLAVSTAPSRSWRLMTLFRGGVRAPAIRAIACTPSGLCLVGTQTGALWRSPHPARGAGAFTRFKLSHRAIVGLACRSRRLCVAVDELGRVFWSTNPAGGASTWREKALDFHDWPTTGGRLTALACAPTAVCLAGDGGGRVYSGAD